MSLEAAMEAAALRGRVREGVRGGPKKSCWGLPMYLGEQGEWVEGRGSGGIYLIPPSPWN